jgi:hypothetical protein
MIMNKNSRRDSKQVVGFSDFYFQGKSLCICVFVIVFFSVFKNLHVHCINVKCLKLTFGITMIIGF